MAVIQVNAPSINQSTKSFVEGNGRRKFLVSIIKLDPENVMHAYAEGVRKSASVWIPLKATTVDASGQAHEFNPAEHLTQKLIDLKAKGSGERVHMNVTIRSLEMSKPTPSPSDKDIVYQDCTVNLDENQLKRFTVVAPAPWVFED